ncbi:MAG: hypothetical protein GPJ54_12795 [Candidatus Heimdallarchaeota archaeon]|nr:hypothetical protein [Candidatus Heimdallarchaeota archaeon]
MVLFFKFTINQYRPLNKLYFRKIKFLFCLIVILSSIISTNSQTTNQIPDLPHFDDKTYSGLEYGTAGISIALLEAYTLSDIDITIKKQLLNIVENSLEKLWEERIEYNGVRYPTWKSSVEDEYLSVYPGLKYGAPGIIHAFLKIFEITQESKWLDRAEESYWYLSTQAINESSTPHWPYHFSIPKEDSGISITDLKYGSAGVLSLGIELFQVTQNQTYLDHGELIVSWLDEISYILVQNEIDYKIIPWYSIDGSTSQDLPFYLTRGFGLAGISPYLYQFGVHAKLDKNKDWAIQLGRLIVELQLDDGSWYIASDSQVINIGFDNGVAGIIDGLFQLKSLTSSPEFDDAISQGIDWLFSRYLSNSTHVGFFNYLNADSDIEMINSLYDGNIGILRTLTKLISFLNTNQVDLLIHAYKWLITSGSFIITNNENELLFLLSSLEKDQFVDFSYAQGLAGLLSELINLENTFSIATRINFNITRAIVAAINTFEYFQQISGHWQRQYVIPLGWNLDHFTIINISESDYSPTIIPTELETNITSMIEPNPEEWYNNVFYYVSLVILLPIIYGVKRTKISKK